MLINPKSVHCSPLTTVLKKIVAIFFLAVLGFNWLGFRFVFAYLEHRQNTRLEAQLDDNDYDESSLISLKTAFPIQYAYLNNKPDEFERWNGEIEIKGVKYKYVKRRFFNDSLELLCIPNVKANELKKAKQEFANNANDLQSNSDKKQDGKTPTFKNLLSEYFAESEQWNADVDISPQIHSSRYLLLTPQHISDGPIQPPDFS